MLDKIKQYISSGLSVIPVNGKKIPAIKTWKEFQKRVPSYDEIKNNFSPGCSLAIICGKVSGNVEAIDVDLKYDLTKKLFSEFCQLVKDHDDKLLEKLVVQKTTSNGYHLIYKCKKIEGNQKLAKRYANNQEKESGEKIKVLLETRGEGGYILAEPATGYKVVQGSITRINEITPEQRDLLFSCCKHFNEVLDSPVKKTPPVSTEQTDSPLDDYNERGDVVSLLERHGWSHVWKKGTRHAMKRPGDSSAKYSGYYDEQKNWFTVFSTSTEFESEKAYLPYYVYCILECNGDINETCKRLLDEGYGKRKTTSTEAKDDIDVVDYVERLSDLEPELNNSRNRNYKMGEKFGFEDLDNHFVLKEASLVFILGHMNVGKSTITWFLIYLSVRKYNWSWVMYIGENENFEVFEALMEFYWEKRIFEMTDKEFLESKKWVHKSFVFIKNERLYTYDKILDIAEKIKEKKKIKGICIDPYNALEAPLKDNQHNYDYRALSDMQVWKKKHKTAIWITCHANTASLRKRDEEGHAEAPNAGDVEGGGKFPNKADDLLIVHRKTSHPEKWMFTQIIVAKIKRTKTGGKPTLKGDPVILQMWNKGTTFVDTNIRSAFQTKKMYDEEPNI